jgi:hypothetical protein
VRTHGDHGRTGRNVTALNTEGELVPTNTNWLHTFPGPRWTPRRVKRRRVRSYTAHQAYHHPIGAVAHDISKSSAEVSRQATGLLATLTALGLWLVEVCAWCIAWVYYAIFLGARAVYRHNVIGQTVASLTGRRQPQPAYDPYGPPAQPVDLAALSTPAGDWDGPIRRRG